MEVCYTCWDFDVVVDSLLSLLFIPFDEFLLL